MIEYPRRWLLLLNVIRVFDRHSSLIPQNEWGRQDGFPHVLMLTAIVVSVGTLGVALAICLAIHRRYNSLEEDEIQEQLQ